MGIVILIVIVVVAAIVMIVNGDESAANKHTVIPDRPVTFNPNPVPGKEDFDDIKELLNKKYTPRTGAFDIEVFSSIIKPFLAGDQLELTFKKKEAYYQDIFFEIAFKYKGELVATDSKYFNEAHPVIRIVRAHFSGYTVIPTIKSIQDRLLTVGIQFAKNGQKIKSKVHRQKATKTRGRFAVVGYHHLPEDIKRMIWKELKTGDELQLMADPTNEHDKEAIKVLFRTKQIGWVSRLYSRKSFLFQAIIANQGVWTYCTVNDRRQDYRRASRPDDDGNWNDRYLGMAQFVHAKFEMEKE